MAITNGRSALLEVDERATTLVLATHADIEVRRVPLHLKPGPVQILEP